MESVAKVWEEAFLEYKYQRVNLNKIRRLINHSLVDCLNKEIGREIEEIIDFLDYFKHNCYFNYCPYVEVVAWYYYKTILRFKKVHLLENFLNAFLSGKVTVDEIFVFLKDFSRKPEFGKLVTITKKFDIYPHWRQVMVILSFFSPEKFILLNNDILKNNKQKLYINFEIKNINITNLNSNSYNLFINISNWCSRVAQALTEAAKLFDTVHKKNWTAFDVEKALHTFARKYKKNKKTKEVPPIPKIH